MSKNKKKTNKILDQCTEIQCEGRRIKSAHYLDYSIYDCII